MCHFSIYYKRLFLDGTKYTARRLTYSTAPRLLHPSFPLRPYCYRTTWRILRPSLINLRIYWTSVQVRSLTQDTARSQTLEASHTRMYKHPVNLCKTPSVYSNKIIPDSKRRRYSCCQTNCATCARVHWAAYTLCAPASQTSASKCTYTEIANSLLWKDTSHINIRANTYSQHKCNNYVVICEIAKTLKNINIRTNHLLLCLCARGVLCQL